jgi:UDP-4-amino-4,6-dideoxy-N-acetyl-beta-L-altrosamine N-acetyltransferase
MPGRNDFNLRPMTESDLDLVLTWRNSKRIRDISYTDHVISIAEHRAWFARTAQDQSSLHFIFEFSGRPIGVVNITKINQSDKSCTWGFYLGETDLPKGCGSSMGFFALDFMFTKLDMHTITGEAFAFNGESLTFHKRLGFAEEKRITGGLVKNGVRQDIIIMHLSLDAWSEIKPVLEKKFFTDRTCHV